ncbi:MAG: hypothetical protein ABEJ84_01365 [Halodesulfurarchaeum sp.]
MNEESVVVRNGVTVRKSFSADDFPVPAVTFEVASTREEPVDLRITDTIPEGFGVEQIGFHPDYGSEHWTATGDGGVRFERSVDPGEEFTTVYGVRMRAEDQPGVFLEEPDVEVDPTEAAETAEVVPEESSSVVRELARGERETVPGLEGDETDAAGPEPEATVSEPGDVASAGVPDSDTGADTGPEGAADEGDALEQRLEDAESDSESGSGTESGESPEGESPPGTESGAGSDTQSAAETMTPIQEESPDEPRDDTEAAESATRKSTETRTGESTETRTGESTETRTGESAESTTEAVDTDTQSPSEQTAVSPESTTDRSMHSETDSIVAAFAAEIEAGTIDDANLAVIREALEEDRPNQQVRLAQSDQVRLEHLQSRVSDLEAYTDALERFLDEEGRGDEIIADLEAEIGAFEEELAEIDSRLDSAAAERDTMSEHLENLESTVEAIAGVAEQIERVRGDVEALDERVADVEEVSADVSALESKLETVEAELEEITEWRDQLSDVFG